MKITVAYIAVTHSPNMPNLSARFAASWQLYPPGVDCKLVVICNGGPLKPEHEFLFAGLPNVTFNHRTNDEGKDISAYIELSRTTDADMLVCMGESVYFHRSGWLSRMVEAWNKHGPGMYGFFASHAVRAHMNTTAFVIDPKHLREYPRQVITHDERYEFEHGKHSMWRRLMMRRIPVMFVTWDGVWPPRRWREPKNILHRGDQSNLLISCNHTDRFKNASPRVKSEWSMQADKMYQ